MNKVLLYDNDVKFVFDWKEQHKDLVREAFCPMKAVKIICPDVKIVVTAVRDKEKGDDIVTLRVRHENESLGKIAFKRLPLINKWYLYKDTNKMSQDEKNSIMTLYFTVMALFVFGNTNPNPAEKQIVKKANLVKQTRHKNIRKSDSKSNFCYIINRESQRFQLGTEKHHKSPTGEFSVRGHFRHYKNGNVIWISEFIKGSGKQKNKIYKLNKGE